MGYTIEAGEGYRILDKSEPVQEGDEFRNPADPDQTWFKSRNWYGGGAAQRQDSGLVYRRRVVAESPEPAPFHPEWVPKPFTPNKYTRTLLSLDGRQVPVDVYAVLAAFPSNSAAVDHALKKLLAPGQRGQKDRLQDLKEARASLDRAIQMEGG